MYCGARKLWYKYGISTSIDVPILDKEVRYIVILINKQEKDLVLRFFPNTMFIRTCRQKSHRHRYYMSEEKDQLRFLSGMPKTQKNNETGEIKIVIPASPVVNNAAIKAFENLLINNIKYYKGELGGMSNNGELLDELQVQKSNGLKKFCDFELSQLRKKHKEILKK